MSALVAAVTLVVGTAAASPAEAAGACAGTGSNFASQAIAEGAAGVRSRRGIAQVAGQ